MKILAYTMAAAGHLNSVIGLCQALLERSHQIYFVIEPGFTGKLSKFGFDEIVLQGETKKDKKLEDDQNLQTQNPIKYYAEKVKQMGLLSSKSPKEKVQAMADDDHMTREMIDKSIVDEVQVRAILEEIKPDVILVDSFFVLPCFVHSQIPWVLVWSANPNVLYNSSQLPPPASGLPSFDRTSWNEFEDVLETLRRRGEEAQNRLLSYFGYPPIERKGYIQTSPYLNIYGYPEELDYRDIAQPPDNVIQIDAFNRYIPEPYEFPDKFKAKLNPGDKVVYISLGSMGAIDLELMNRIVSALGETPHKYVVSKGPLSEEYDLPGNMWGEGFLPQTSILPLVDLVITHGGNNTITETICSGKPLIVMPLFSDQYDNAQRVHEKQFGVRIEPYHFEPHQLVEAVDRLLCDDATRHRVEQAAKRIEQSNSKQKACIALEKLVQKHST